MHELEFRKGVLISASLRRGCVGGDYTFWEFPKKQGSWILEIRRKRLPVYSFSIDPRDENGARILSELKDQGVHAAADALAQSVHHVVHFFEALRQELAFYLACLHLYEQLSALGELVCFPVPCGASSREYYAQELYDPCLALTMRMKVVGNDVCADGRELVIVTGANQGGKSTFLRSVGIAQFMMQCGMFVPARTFRAHVCRKIFMHFYAFQKEGGRNHATWQTR